MTIDQIVARANVAKGTFYRYVDSKRALVHQILEPLHEGLVTAFANCRAGLETADRDSLAAVYMRLASDLADAVRANEDRTRLYLQECRTPGGEREPVAALATAIRDGAIELTALAQERGLLQGTPAWVPATVVIGAAEELLLAYLTGEHPAEEPSDVQAVLVAMVLRGIAI